MGRVLELGNSANWDLIWTESFTGQVVTPTFTNLIDGLFSLKNREGFD